MASKLLTASEAKKLRVLEDAADLAAEAAVRKRLALDTYLNALAALRCPYKPGDILVKASEVGWGCRRKARTEEILVEAVKGFEAGPGTISLELVCRQIRKSDGAPGRRREFLAFSPDFEFRDLSLKSTAARTEVAS